MKINIAKLLRVVGRVIVAAPVIIEAVKPVLRGRKARRQENGTAMTTSRSVNPDDAPAIQHRHKT